MALTRIGNQAITLDAAEIPNLDASKITTGTLANARIAEASVTQHVTETDLQPIKSDISALALREATNEASAAFNLPNQFIETFTDDTNLGTQTDGDRVSGAWKTITSAYAGTATEVDYFGSTTYKVWYSNGTQTSAHANDTWHNIETDKSTDRKYIDAGEAILHSSGYSNIWTGSGTDHYMIVDYLASKKFSTYLKVGKNNGWGDMDEMAIHYSTDNSTYTALDLTGASATTTLGVANSGSLSGGTYSAYSDPTTGSFRYGQHGTGQYGSSYVKITGWSDFDARYIKITKPTGGHGGTANNNCGGGILTPYEKVLTESANATGTLIQSANTVASAKTKVGGTMLYKDASGTATLGTDLKIYFSCNNGGAWTEAASYNAITPVYSTGIKQVRLGETTCTSGTGVIYKAVWANQASGSKVTELHGIGVNY